MKAAERPAPKPPLEARPPRLSVTAIEDWLRDPYTIYASIFSACSRSMRSTRRPARATAAPSSTAPSATSPKLFAAKPPADPMQELLALGEKHFAPLADYPEARAFWWPRFVRIARWFAAGTASGAPALRRCMPKSAAS